MDLLAAPLPSHITLFDVFGDAMNGKLTVGVNRPSALTCSTCIHPMCERLRVVDAHRARYMANDAHIARNEFLSAM